MRAASASMRLTVVGNAPNIWTPVTSFPLPIPGVSRWLGCSRRNISLINAAGCTELCLRGPFYYKLRWASYYGYYMVKSPIRPLFD